MTKNHRIPLILFKEEYVMEKRPLLKIKTATDPPKYANMYITSGFDNSQTTAIHLIIPNF